MAIVGHRGGGDGDSNDGSIGNNNSANCRNSWFAETLTSLVCSTY